MGVTEDYFKYTKEWKKTYGEKTMVLMQVGSFFECYAVEEADGTYTGSNIRDLADTNDLSIARKNSFLENGKQIVLAGFGLLQLEKYVKKLQEIGYTIVVYTQDTQSKNTTRSLSCIFSPGTYFSNDSQELSNNTTCIWVHYCKANKVLSEQICIGIANVDIYTGKASVYEFTNEFIHTPCTYDELEKYVAIYKPSECIIISNLQESYIDSIIKFTNINSAKIHKILLDDDTNTNTNNLIKAALNSEKQNYQQEIIKQFYSKSNDIFFENLYKYYIASQSLCFLLDFLYKHNPHLVNKISEPVFENHKNKLILANHSLKQLNIINDSRNKGKLSSVCDLLNNCITTIGKRRFNYDLLNPICDIETLNNSYNITEHLLNNSNIWQHFRIVLGNIRDIEKIRRKLIMGKISPHDFYYLYENLSIIKDLDQNIKNSADGRTVFNYINDFVYGEARDLDNKTNESCQKILDFIDKYFNLDFAKTIDDITSDKLSNLNMEQMHFINKGINKAYDDKMRECIDSREQLECIREFFCKLIKTYEKTAKTNDFIKIHETAKMDAMLIGTNRRVNILQGEINKLIKQKTEQTTEQNNNSNGSATITLSYTSKYTNSKESIILNLTSIEYLTHGGNKSNLIVTSPEIKFITNNIQTSKDTLIANIISFYSTILSEFTLIQEVYLNNIILYITQVDILQCKAYIATKYNYFKPQIDHTSEKSFVEIEKLRHSLIEQINDKEIYVSNDLTLGKEINGILLYGTNAVGKTCLIKSIGIALIMAQSGLYVPASTFKYYPYNYLFTRILGNDNIFKGLSTFAVEMSELRTILKLSDKNSMILGDELCSGTESTSALSIFVSGIEKLYSLESTFIFATHFHEIVKYNEIQELEKLKLYHMSVIYNNKDKKLIYDRKLKDGPGESMYGLEVCKALDLPEEFLNRAHELRTKYIKDFNVLNMGTSRYNSKKIKGACEICNLNVGEEIHHLQYQSAAENNYINNEFHKNHVANLINICYTCHDKVHKHDEQYKIVKTSNGYELLKL